MSEPIRIILVDDHLIVRRALKSFLTAYPDLAVVGEASSGEEALAQVETWLPDVAVMDLMMPGGIDGIETIRRLKQMAPNIRVVVLTSATEDSRVLAALKAGAIGYVRKEADTDLLLASIRAAARNQSLLDPSVASAIMQELSHSNRTGIDLTDREAEVLRQLALGRTNREIAEALVISEETVKTHVGNILTKLHLDHRTQAAIYALKKGLISLDEIALPEA